MPAIKPHAGGIDYPAFVEIVWVGKAKSSFPRLETIDALEFLARVIAQIPEPKRHLLFSITDTTPTSFVDDDGRLPKHPDRAFLLGTSDKKTSPP